MTKITRREFVEGTVKAATGAAVWGAASGRRADGAEQTSPPRVSANDRITVALIGCGSQGRSDLGALLRLREIECAALCDVDDHRLSETAQSVAVERGRKPDTYRDFRKVLERKDVQAVVVATPDHWHALPTVLACQAGKDVYVEKPLATSIMCAPQST